jgi:ferredoxin-thioredoxin reductase catalytic subunit/rubredoxin
VNQVTDAEVDSYYEIVKRQAESAGYHLNPDEKFTKDLLKSILINKERYGYGACPCRLASGVKEDDLDLVCPCDYRDPDLDEFGACYCGLYISSEILEGKKTLRSIPERRLSPEERLKAFEKDEFIGGSLPYPVWRCKVCGYLCARKEPPELCPICKVEKKRFERFI